jgi:hypothetical protein
VFAKKNGTSKRTRQMLHLLLSKSPKGLFFLLVQKEPKKTPEMDYIPISGSFPDWAFVLLWVQHR